MLPWEILLLVALGVALVFCVTAILLWRAWQIKVSARSRFRCADCEGWNQLHGGHYWALRPSWPCYGGDVRHDGPVCKYFLLRGSRATRAMRKGKSHGDAW